MAKDLRARRPFANFAAVPSICVSLYKLALIASQAHPHLKYGTVYRQVRPTVVDSNYQMSNFSP